MTSNWNITVEPSCNGARFAMPASGGHDAALSVITGYAAVVTRGRFVDVATQQLPGTRVWSPPS